MKSNKKTSKRVRYKNFFLGVVLTGIMLLVLGATCTKENDMENNRTLKQLYEWYRNGQISRCKYNGETVYRAGLNAYDAGSVIYDKEGKKIGTCRYAWGEPDAICGQLTECETIYRVKDNIWGEPPIDKYGLGNEKSSKGSQSSG